MDNDKPSTPALEGHTTDDLDGMFETNDLDNILSTQEAEDETTNEFLDWLDQDDANAAADSTDDAVALGNDASFDFDKDVLGEDDDNDLHANNVVRAVVEEEINVRSRTTSADEAVSALDLSSHTEDIVVQSEPEVIADDDNDAEQPPMSTSIAAEIDTTEKVSVLEGEEDDDIAASCSTTMEENDVTSPVEKKVIPKGEGLEEVAVPAAPIPVQSKFEELSKPATAYTATTEVKQAPDINEVAAPPTSVVEEIQSVSTITTAAVTETTKSSIIDEDEKLIISETLPAPTTTASTPAPASTAVKKQKHPSTNFSEMIRSQATTLKDVQQASKAQKFVISIADRPHLWTKVTCGKTLDIVADSSIAESFATSSAAIIAEGHTTDEERLKGCAALCRELAERVVDYLGAGSDGNANEVQQELAALLVYHQHSWQNDETVLLSIASVVLAAGIVSPVSGIVLRNIIPTFMPLMGLGRANERVLAMKALHKKFYLLTCYHLPLLVQHLDRFAPGWYWPKGQGDSSSSTGNVDDDSAATQIGRNIEDYGALPNFWFASCFAGGSFGIDKLVPLWDILLSRGDSSLKFFLGLALLEKHAESLLLTKGGNVRLKLEELLNLYMEESTGESMEFVKDWLMRAENMIDSSPKSIVDQMNEVEDVAISLTNKRLEQKVEDEIKENLNKEKERKRVAKLAEELRKSEKANTDTNKLRLKAYYEKYNPGKAGDVEKIIKHYKGRLDQLDRNLTSKYGEGFQPILPAKSLIYTLTENANFISSIQMKSNGVDGAIDNRAALLENGGVSFKISASEVLPSIFSRKSGKAKSVVVSLKDSVKYILVDARDRRKASVNGRFPTAVHISPEMFLDPDSIKDSMEMFESIRGTIHICILGDGIESIPELYDVPLNEKAKEVAMDDHANTNLCALFMIKKGFPFVSILDGGFAAAHSWLVREGPSHELDVSSLLVDYGIQSEWALLEKGLNERDICLSEMEEESTLIKKMRLEIIQRNMSTSVTKVITAGEVSRPLFRSQRPLFSDATSEIIQASASKFFNKKEGGAAVEDAQSGLDGLASNGKDKARNDSSSAATVSKPSFGQKFRKPFGKFTAKKSTNPPLSTAGGSVTDGSSMGSASSEEGTAAVAKENEKGTSFSFEKKKMFGGFRKYKKMDEDAPAASRPESTRTSNTEQSVFTKNPFGKFGRKSKWSLSRQEKVKREPSPTRSNSSETSEQEISFGNVPVNEVAAFDIGGLSDDED